MGVEARRLEDFDRGEAMECRKGNKLAFAETAGDVLQRVQLLDQQVALRPREASCFQHRRDGRAGLRRDNAPPWTKAWSARPGFAWCHKRVRSRHLRA